MMSLPTHRLPVLYLTADLLQAWRFKQEFGQELAVQVITSPDQALAACAEPAGFVALVVAADPGSACGLPLARALRRPGGPALPVLWWLPARTAPALLRALRETTPGNAFVQHADNERFLTRLYALARQPQLPVAPVALPALRLPARKRLLDVLGAGAAMLLLSPLLALLALLIKLESRGPLFTYSYRLGAGYRAFRLWKLRSLHLENDEQLAAFKNLNQDQGRRRPVALAATGRCASCARAGCGCQQPATSRAALVGKSRELAASQFPAFIKIVNDSRVTRIGRFLRSTRLEKLPQLFNVLRGDMSLVGNRPLPLCEAAQLRTHEQPLSFWAPAGITGPWQLGGRCQQEHAPAPAYQLLDSSYLRSFSLRKDLKIIFKTLPALFHKENV